MVKMSYEEWFARLSVIASVHDIEIEDDTWWRDDYEAGLTPDKAFHEEYTW